MFCDFVYISSVTNLESLAFLDAIKDWKCNHHFSDDSSTLLQLMWCHFRWSCQGFYTLSVLSDLSHITYSAFYKYTASWGWDIWFLNISYLKLVILISTSRDFVMFSWWRSIYQEWHFPNNLTGALLNVSTLLKQVSFIFARCYFLGIICHWTFLYYPAQSLHDPVI